MRLFNVHVPRMRCRVPHLPSHQRIARHKRLQLQFIRARAYQHHAEPEHCIAQTHQFHRIRARESTNHRRISVLRCTCDSCPPNPRPREHKPPAYQRIARLLRFLRTGAAPAVNRGICRDMLPSPGRRREARRRDPRLKCGQSPGHRHNRQFSKPYWRSAR